MPVVKRFMIQDAETNEMLSYGDLTTTQRALHHLLWQTYVDHIGIQKATDPETLDPQHMNDDEPCYLGAFESARDDIASNIDLWTRPDDWNVAMHYAKIRIYAVDPNRKFRNAFEPFKPWHEVDICGPLPTDEPTSDINELLQEFFKYEKYYMNEPDLPIGAILSDQEAGLFVDSWYQDHPEDWPDDSQA
ncbi:hypothetical protein [Lacticaseibacillus jixiensis]|uniref:hypothetical protein n=1 Tax=Lacticaseibacillus jixiensis TaxID=3231926 RepID=UPI0036F40D38